MLERYLSVAQACEETGLGRRTLYRAIERREMPVLLPNGCRRGMRIPESGLRRWLERRTEPVA